MFNNAIQEIKDSGETTRDDLMERNFDFIWDHLQYLSTHAEYHAVEMAETIESQILEGFKLNELEDALNKNNPNDPVLIKFHQMLKSNIEDEYFGGIKNNRNAYIILDGANTILEDLMVDPTARGDSSLGDKLSTDLNDYRESTYNVDMFDSAFNKIRTHSNLPIVIEPYNYIDGDHIMLKEMSYNALKEVYLAEGLNGLRNYQFLVPAYITDSGDIFGHDERISGSNENSHKFVVIQTFNLYDQIVNIDPEFESGEQYESAINRHERMLSAIYILGIMITAVSVFIVLYFFTLYNNLLDDID